MIVGIMYTLVVKIVTIKKYKLIDQCFNQLYMTYRFNSLQGMKCRLDRYSLVLNTKKSNTKSTNFRVLVVRFGKNYFLFSLVSIVRYCGSTLHGRSTFFYFPTFCILSNQICCQSTRISIQGNTTDKNVAPIRCYNAFYK